MQEQLSFNAKGKKELIFAVRLQKSSKWSPVTAENTSKAGKSDAGVGEGALSFLELGLTADHRLMGVCPSSCLFPTTEQKAGEPQRVGDCHRLSVSVPESWSSHSLLKPQFPHKV